ncbi:MAG: porin [Flavobacteriales bacterium]|mgnify:CR=1 FL=1|jgi:phosphate-selective porin OprO and OprP|nr:porin [Flavobacteriales bacterium]MBT6746575.1 porin [Flavobacteriales bacterium]
MKHFGFALAFLTITVFGFAQTKIANKFGKGLYYVMAEDSSFKMKFGARFQSLYIGEWDLIDGADAQNGSSNFLIRRSRLKFDGFAFSPNLIYKLEIGLSNRDIGKVSSYTNQAPNMILDAALKWNIFGNFSIWGGQTKLPGNRERFISSGNLQFVDRSLLNSKYNIDRDIGIQLHNHFSIGQVIISEAFAFSQGEGRNITVGNIGGYEYTGRIEILPFGAFSGKDYAGRGDEYVGSSLKRDETPKLAIAATYDYNQGSPKTRGNLGNFMANDIGHHETDIQTIFVDMMFKFKGLSMMAEYANKQANDPLAKNSDGTETGDKVYVGQGVNVQLGYLLKNNLEIAARYTSITPETAIGNPFSQYTLGISKYIVGHKLKVQGDVSYNTFNGSKDTGLMTRLQFDIHF